MNISASVKNSYNANMVKVATNGNMKSIEINPKESGFGSSVNGAELLLSAIATCFCNDIYREAAKRNLRIKGVEVEVTCEFGVDGEQDDVTRPVHHSEAYYESPQYGLYDE